MKLLIIFILVLTLVVLVSWLPLRFKFHYSKKGENDYISITWQIIPPIWGITLEIPFIKISPTEVWPILKIITQLEGEKGQTLGEHEKNIPLNQYRFKRFLEKASFVLTRTGELTTLGKWFISKITLREFSWCTEIGTDEAGKTGILVGIIWAIKSTVYGYLHTMVKKVKKYPQISVLPNFQQKKAFCNMVCIFDISCGHIIIGGFKTLSVLFFKKGGDKV
ncbi:MAG: DUF2953 domain-containing protein [Bacillota bacterium]|nr:DUF2953 domain-containing protein [Clostridia bacterium]